MRLKKSADWINYDSGDSRTFQILSEAIEYQSKVRIEYNGVWKEISPFAFGTGNNGNTVVKCYTLPGEGKGMDGPDNGLNVRSYSVDKITGINPMPNDNTDKGKYNENINPMNEYDDLQNTYDKNYGTDKYIAINNSRLKRLANEDEGDMTFDEIKQEILNVLEDAKSRVNEWSVRDSLTEFTNWGFYKGEAMSIIDMDMAKDICDQLIEYVKSITERQDYALYEIAENLHI